VTLGAWLRETHRPWRDVLSRYVDAGRGLAAVHAASLVHRDFKPHNVLLGRDGRVRITDFGLARSADAPVSARGDAPDAASSTDVSKPHLGPLTATGAVHGTPAYMAPEQREGHATQQSDQFSFALSLYESLYGETAFETVDGQLAYGQVRPPPKGSEVPDRLRTIVLRALRVDPAARFPSMTDLVEALRLDPPRAWWRRSAIAAALMVLLVGGAAWAHYGRRDPGAMCRGGEQRLVGAWDADRKRAVHEGLLATGSPLASEAWRFAELGFDDYARRWVSGYTDACEATRVRGEQSGELLDRRMRCLDDRLSEMKALTVLLSHADAKMVGDAAEASRGLMRIEQCANTRELAEALPPPRDTAAAAEVDRIRSVLAQGRALREAGRYADALVVATSAAERAHGVKYRPLEAEALFLEGELQGKLRDGKAAEASLYAALAAAEAGHHDEFAARVWVKLVYQVGVRGARYDEARRLDDLARAAIERLGRADEIEGKRLATEGLVLDAEGHHAEAIDAERRGVELLLGVYGHDDLDVALSLQYLGEALHNAGRLEEATATLQESESILEAIVGPAHPSVAGVLDDIGSLLRTRGRVEEAITYHRRALAIAETAVGPSSADVSYGSDSLAEDLAALGRWDEALAMFQRSVAVAEQAMGPEHPYLATPLTGEGEAYLGLGQSQNAIAPLDRALASRRAHGASSAELERTRVALERARRP